MFPIRLFIIFFYFFQKFYGFPNNIFIKARNIREKEEKKTAQGWYWCCRTSYMTRARKSVWALNQAVLNVIYDEYVRFAMEQVIMFDGGASTAEPSCWEASFKAAQKEWIRRNAQVNSTKAHVIAGGKFLVCFHRTGTETKYKIIKSHFCSVCHITFVRWLNGRIDDPHHHSPPFVWL